MQKPLVDTIVESLMPGGQVSYLFMIGVHLKIKTNAKLIEPDTYLMVQNKVVQYRKSSFHILNRVLISNMFGV